MSVNFIVVKMVVEDAATRRRSQDEDDLDHAGGEDDGFAEVQPADARGGRAADGTRWKPLTISVDTIRNFYPRAGGREGTRILLKSGAAYAVVNDFSEIVTALGGAVADLTRASAEG